MCKYSDDSGYKCPHKSLEDSDYCIFHLQDDNKDSDEFNKGIKEILETEEDLINFYGFYFPPGTTDFSTQNFKKAIKFINATFSEKADFRHATFSEKAYFGNATFSEKAYFGNAKFSEAYFRFATFSEKAYFRGATFSEKAYFGGATFSEKAYFSHATFSEKVYFRFATFSGDADFIHATFSEADFNHATFSEKAYFSHAAFSEADFSHAAFSGEADFGDATFSEANFWHATFSGEADFRHAELTGKFVFIPEKSETIIFENIYFSDNVRIKADMGKCSFANSNIERVDMTDSIWIRDDDKPIKSFPTFFVWIRNKLGMSETLIKIWEEQQGKISSDWKQLEGIYRRLEQSYQKFGDTSTAGIFYYRKKECIRKQSRGLIAFIWNNLIWILCGYGEKPFRLILASLFLIVLSAFSFLFGGIEFVGSNVLKVPPDVIDYNLSLNSFGIQWVMNNIDSVLEDLLLCLYTSVITFTTLGYGDVRPIGLSRIFASLEAGLGIIMTALFIFVFTRKMLR